MQQQFPDKDRSKILGIVNEINIIFKHTIDTVINSEIEVQALRRELNNLKAEITEIKSTILLGQIARKFEKTLLKEILIAERIAIQKFNHPPSKRGTTK